MDVAVDEIFFFFFLSMCLLHITLRFGENKYIDEKLQTAESDW